MLAIFSIAVLVSFFFTLDLLQTPKKGGFYLRNLIQVIAVSIPSIYKSMNNSQADFLVMWDRYFYCIFTASFFIFIGIAYFFHYKKTVNALSKYDDIEKEFSFLGFLQSGNKSFQDEINKLIKDSTNKKSKMTSTVFKSLGNTLPLYIRDLNLTLVDNNDNPDYTLIALHSLIFNGNR